MRLGVMIFPTDKSIQPVELAKEVDGHVVASTPSFLGCDPACARLLGSLLRPLAGPEDLARELMRSLAAPLQNSALLLFGADYRSYSTTSLDGGSLFFNGIDWGPLHISLIRIIVISTTWTPPSARARATSTSCWLSGERTTATMPLSRTWRK